MKKNEKEEVLSKKAQKKEGKDQKPPKKGPEEYFSFNEQRNEFKEKVKKTLVVIEKTGFLSIQGQFSKGGRTIWRVPENQGKKLQFIRRKRHEKTQ